MSSLDGHQAVSNVPRGITLRPSRFGNARQLGERLTN
jgi:hypothetical protein